MSISNKEVIIKLTEYFMKQDKETICRTLANMMIDYNRLANPDLMDEDEKERLYYRIQENAKQIQKFAREGDQGIPFTNINIENLKV